MITNCLFDEFKPMYYWTKIFGLCPFQINFNSGKPNVIKTKLSIIYSLLVLVLFDAYISYFFNDILKYLDEFALSSNAAQRIYHVIFISESITYNIAVLYSIFHINTTLISFKILQECESTLMKYGARIEVNNSKNKTFFIILITLFFGGLGIVRKMHVCPAATIGLCLVLLANAACKHHILSWCLLFSGRFKALNSYLLSFSKFELTDNAHKPTIVFRNNARKMFFKSDDMRNLSRIHARLSHAIRDLNNIYSIILLISSGLFFMWITLQSFVLVCRFLGLTAMDSSMILNNFIWLFQVIVEYIIFVWACAEVSFHANDVRKHLIRFKIQPGDKKMRREIINFLVQLVDDGLQITALGFFNIDLPFVQNNIGAVTTYVVILIQSCFA